LSISTDTIDVGKFAISLDLVRRRGERGPERAGTRDAIRAIVQNLAYVSTSCARVWCKQAFNQLCAQVAIDLDQRPASGHCREGEVGYGLRTVAVSAETR